MTYFLKDCGREVSPPAKEREDIARAVAETFATRPYIRFALFIEPYADGSGDDSVELIAVPDGRFGIPLIPWAATGCEEFAYDLVAALGRDVDCCLDKCERARLSLIHRTLTPIYRRPDSAIEPADRYLTSARADAMIASSALRCHRMNADHVARHAARTVGQRAFSRPPRHSAAKTTRRPRSPTSSPAQSGAGCFIAGAGWIRPPGGSKPGCLPPRVEPTSAKRMLWRRRALRIDSPTSCSKTAAPPSASGCGGCCRIHPIDRKRGGDGYPFPPLFNNVGSSVTSS